GGRPSSSPSPTSTRPTTRCPRTTAAGATRPAPTSTLPCPCSSTWPSTAPASSPGGVPEVWLGAVHDQPGADHQRGGDGGPGARQHEGVQHR
ncbi:hypothetical protein CFC21_074589, partial [Triticum aestivum]